MNLDGKTILITGAARRIGKHLALAVAQAGADVILHHANSPADAAETAEMIERLNRRVWVLQADFSEPEEVEALISRAWESSPLYALVNNAAIFVPLSLAQTSLVEWQTHLNINLTAPFLLSRGFGARLPAGEQGRIVNILDWRALHPGSDHFPYTVSKAALAALTRSLAGALAPNITVNGLALGAILPPAGSSAPPDLLEKIPAGRWGTLDEVSQALLFLLAGPTYITGEIVHLDGGRHLV
jgi:pteridine reductase